MLVMHLAQVSVLGIACRCCNVEENKRDAVKADRGRLRPYDDPQNEHGRVTGVRYV
jgi:hypothetical protein